MLCIIFTLFVGAILALFIGFGIHTIYPPPEPPETAIVELKANPSDADIEKASAAHKPYDVAYQAYSRNVSMVSMAGAVIPLTLSLVLERRNKVMESCWARVSPWSTGWPADSYLVTRQHSSLR